MTTWPIEDLSRTSIFLSCICIASACAVRETQTSFGKTYPARYEPMHCVWTFWQSQSKDYLCVAGPGGPPAGRERISTPRVSRVPLPPVSRYVNYTVDGLRTSYPWIRNPNAGMYVSHVSLQDFTLLISSAYANKFRGFTHLAFPYFFHGNVTFDCYDAYGTRGLLE